MLYVAHTTNDAVDILDIHNDRYLRSISNLSGVAGVLVSNEKDLIFTSNRAEKTVGIFPQASEGRLEKVSVGGRPNGLAFDPSRGHLLAANVIPSDSPEPVTVSIVDAMSRRMIADVRVPGRTRWTLYDPVADRFYVNVAKPPRIMILEGSKPDKIEGTIEIPGVGPHGLDIDVKGRRLFCACDDRSLYKVELDSKAVSKVSDLAGPPDVIFYNSKLEHLYVAIGNPGVIQVLDTKSMGLVQTVETERDAHTLAFNQATDKVYAFAPESHRAIVYVDN